MKLVKALWDMMNGNKMKASSIAVLVAIAVRQVFGIEVDTKDIMANYDLVAGGAVYFIGLIHDIYKRFKATKK